MSLKASLYIKRVAAELLALQHYTCSSNKQSLGVIEVIRASWPTAKYEIRDVHDGRFI